MSDQATDEEVGALKERIAAEIDKDSLEWIIELLPKLLARLEAVERERAQIERDLKFCEE